ncbi:site-specific integrase [Pseudorhizobium marinum]|uniref:site-specific integrase n=1 Tax=Pseudorhizobium marinum TaxID=1496690 RepID=UPI000496295B|nr:site-specific integrase [Pseudorhizobium marinum]
MSFEMNIVEMERFHQETVSKFRLPPLVIASRKTPDGRILEGNQMNIHHNHWGVRQIVGRGDEKIMWFDFDNVVDVRSVRLTAPRRKLDYTVKKVLVLSNLGATGEKPTAPLLAINRSRQYDQFVRWRLSNGIEHNDNLTKHHFETFCDDMSGDPINFLPIMDRLDFLFREIAQGKLHISEFYKEDAKNHRQYFDWPKLAELLGTTKIHLSTSRTFVAELIDRLGSLDHPLVPKLVDSLNRKGDREDRDDYAESSVQKRLYPWMKLYRLAVEGVLNSGVLTFNAFEKRTPTQVVRSLQLRQAQRTSTLEPEDFVGLLKEASKWVFEYGDYICEAVEARRAHTSGPIKAHGKRFVARIDPLRPEGAPKLHYGWTMPEVPGSEAEGRISLGSAVKLLLASCAIIIGCFSARRGGEIQMLRSNCITQVGAHYYLKVYIEKTLQGIDKIPVPKMVSAAVEMLHRLSQGSGYDQAYAPLFNFLKLTSRVSFEFTQNMKDFVEYTGLRPANPEAEWDLASHQLRRGFAIYYYYGFEWMDLDSLAYMLRHFDPEMTRVYVTEAIAGEVARLEDELRARSSVAKEKYSKELKAWTDKTKEQIADLRNVVDEFDEVRVGAYVRRMISQQKGDDHAIGRGVTRLKLDLETMVAAAAADVRITSATNDEGTFREALAKRLTTQAANRFLEPVPGGVAHCTANLKGGDDLSLAECNKLSAAAKSPGADERTGRYSKVDLAFSGIYPCLNCIYGVLFKPNQRIVEQRLTNEEAAIETAPHEREKERRRAALARRREAYRAAREAAEIA